MEAWIQIQNQYNDGAKLDKNGGRLSKYVKNRMT